MLRAGRSRRITKVAIRIYATSSQADGRTRGRLLGDTVRGQCRLLEIHAAVDLESVLTAEAGTRGRLSPAKAVDSNDPALRKRTGSDFDSFDEINVLILAQIDACRIGARSIGVGATQVEHTEL
jgi:hypothetical protein